MMLGREQLRIFGGNCGHLRQLYKDGFIIRRELPLIFVGQLDQADVPTIASYERGGQPTAQGRVSPCFPPEPTPAEMPLEFGLRHAYGLVHLGQTSRYMPEPSGLVS